MSLEDIPQVMFLREEHFEVSELDFPTLESFEGRFLLIQGKETWYFCAGEGTMSHEEILHHFRSRSGKIYGLSENESQGFSGKGGGGKIMLSRDRLELYSASNDFGKYLRDVAEQVFSPYVRDHMPDLSLELR